MKRLWTILALAIAILAVGGGIFLFFYDRETLLLYGALASVLCAVLMLATIWLAYMPKDK